MATTLNAFRSSLRSFPISDWVNEKRDQVVNFLNARNDFFSALHGEEFSNLHVLAGHAFVAGIVILCMVAGWLEGGLL